MSNQFVDFEGHILSVDLVEKMRSGQAKPYRPWLEKPSFLQRVRAAIRRTSDTDDFVLGVDISKWQGHWNIQKTIDAGARYGFIKATQNNWTDSKFDDNANIAYNANFPIGVYHFADPAGRSAVQQSQHFCNVVDGVGELSVVLDMEWTGGLSPYALLNWSRDWWGETTVHLGSRLKEIYTRVSWWNPNVSPYNWEADGIGLWVARWASWLDGPWSDNNYVPRDWDTWVNWQWSADGNGRGSEFGVESKSIDLDYFNGDWIAFQLHYGLIEEPPPPVGDCPNQALVDQHEIEIENLWIKINELEEQIGQTQYIF